MFSFLLNPLLLADYYEGNTYPLGPFYIYNNVMMTNDSAVAFTPDSRTPNYTVKNNIIDGGSTQNNRSNNIYTTLAWYQDARYNWSLASGEFLETNLSRIFVDHANGDYRLRQGSPAIDSGTYVGLPYSGSAPDIGVYESDHTSPTTCLILTKSLKYGTKDACRAAGNCAIKPGNVYNLQKYLNENKIPGTTTNYLSAPPTGYFGILTFNAVRKFQKANGLPSTGYVGPMTINKQKSLTGCIQ